MKPVIFRNSCRMYSLVLAGVLGLYLAIPGRVWAQEAATEQVTETEETMDLGEVRVTTATKTEHQMDDDVPVTVEVITKEELEQADVRTVEDALRYVNGVTVTYLNSNYGTGLVKLHGMESYHTLVLVDGQRIGASGGAILADFSIEMVEQIEIVKGPVSSLYGSDAVGGVINIITKKRSDKPYGSFSLEGGSHNTQIYRGSAGFGKDKFGGVVTYSLHQSDGMNQGVDDYERNTFSASLGYDFNAQSKLEINPFLSKYEVKYAGYTQENNGLNLKWKVTPDQLSNWYLSTSAFTYKYEKDDGTTDNASDYFEGEFGYTRLMGTRHLITAGVHHHQEELEDESSDYSGDQEINAFFIQDEIDLTPLQIVVGARLDHYNQWGTEVSPNLSMCYRLNEKARIRGSVAKAFCAPNLVKLYGEWLFNYFYFHANPDLQPEESIGYQLGFDYRFNERVLGQLTLFRNDIEDMITYYYEWNSSSYLYDAYWTNTGEAMTQGVELSLGTQLSATVSGKIGYTLLDSENKKTGKDLTLRAKNSFNLSLDWQARPDLQFNLSGLYTGKRYEDEANTIRLDDYFLLNMGLEKKFNDHYRMIFSVNNLLGEDGISDAYNIDGVEYYVGVKTRF